MATAHNHGEGAFPHLRRASSKQVGLRLWHVVALFLVAIVGVMSLWLAVAYGELPRIWSRHEHRIVRARDELISYTAQDIPADPINLRIVAPESWIRCAFQRDGWTQADELSLRSSFGIASSVLLGRSYPSAPVSSLYFEDRLQDLAFEKDNGRTAQRRHHVRLWQVGPKQWMGAATFDRGVGFSLYTLQVTHHIGPNVDSERNRVGALLERNGARYIGSQPSHLSPNTWHRNGGGDRYWTDGRIRSYAIEAPNC
jgi:hypothetical protein